MSFIFSINFFWWFSDAWGAFLENTFFKHFLINPCKDITRVTPSKFGHFYTPGVTVITPGLFEGDTLDVAAV